jgi:HEAT repeat protein
MNRTDANPVAATTHAPIRWRAVLVGVAVLAGCRGGGPTLRDEGKGVDELRAMLADADPEVQARGAFGLSRHGPAAKDAVPDLVPKLKSPAPLVRQNAALALGAIGPGAKSAVPALEGALKDPEWAVRRQAALALGGIGPDAKPALPALKKLEASDAQKLVRDAAKQAREKAGG